MDDLIKRASYYVPDTESDIKNSRVLQLEAEFLAKEAAIALAEKQEDKAQVLLSLAAKKYCLQWDITDRIATTNSV